MRRVVLIFALVAAAIGAQAQTVVFQSTSVTDSANKPVTGTIYAQPVLPNGTPTSYHKPGGGVATSAQFPISVTAGAFSVPLSDTALTSPPICFKLTYSTVLTAAYSCVPVSASASYCTTTAGVTTCDLGNYIPTAPPTSPASYVASINGLSGSFTITGLSCNSTTLVCTLSGSSSSSSSVSVYVNGTLLSSTSPAVYVNGTLIANAGGASPTVNGGTL